MRLLKKLHRKIRPDRRPFILAYHRVSELELDPWGMAVTPRNFELQIQALHGRTGGKLTKSIFRSETPKVYITFDDGYSDNYAQALPILQKFEAEATIFLATGFLGSGREYWWDRLERIFLLPGRLPEVLELDVLGDRFRFPLKEAAFYSREDFARHRSWRPWSPPPTLRHMLYGILWSMLHRADRPYQDAMIASLERWAECGSEPRKGYAPMTPAQVREMRDHGIHFGAHTVNHIAPDHCPEHALFPEVSESKKQVTEITGQDAAVFSYPFGQTNARMRAVLEGLDIEVACSSRKSRLAPGTDALLTPRIFASNDSRSFL